MGLNEEYKNWDRAKLEEQFIRFREESAAFFILLVAINLETVCPAHAMEEANELLDNNLTPEEREMTAQFVDRLERTIKAKKNCNAEQAAPPKQVVEELLSKLNKRFQQGDTDDQ